MAGSLLAGLLSLRGAGLFAEDLESIDSRVEALLRKMTLEEKAGQMTQLTLQAVSSQPESVSSRHRLDPGKLESMLSGYSIGSILNVWDAAFTQEHWREVITAIQLAATNTRLRIPVLYGIDAVHGHHYLRNGTVYPHNLGLAATWNPDLVRKIYELTALETRATGIPWNFAPVLDVARQPLWSRFFETFGEDSYLVSVMGVAAIKGQQGEGEVLQHHRVAACAKHFIGYGFPRSGKDRTPAWIPERMLRDIFLPPFQAAIDAGLLTVMINSGEINGIPVHANPKLLTGLLRDELGFEGVAVSDWEDIIKLHSVHRVAESERDAVKQAVLAGIDMSMTPYTPSFHEHLVALVRGGEIPESRVDLSVRRILKLKFRLGLFDDPFPDQGLADRIGSLEARETSRTAARESMTLLKNEAGILPLSKQARVLVTGPGADSLPALHGAWTYTWQGNEESFYPKDTKTIVQAMRESIGAVQVDYVPRSGYSDVQDMNLVLERSRNSDVIVVVAAEKPSVEQPGIIVDLDLPSAQQQLVRVAQSTGKPVVLVLLEDRPRILREIERDTGAILMAYRPGMFGAQTVVDVLFGDWNPSGKLPFTYPRYGASLEPYDHKASERQDLAYAWTAFDPQWPFGHGLSYTRFEYRELSLDKTVMNEDQELTASVTIKNIGNRRGTEIVQWYLSDLYASITPAVKKLKGFTRIELDPGETRRVEFKLDRTTLSFIGLDNRAVLEPGQFEIAAGPLKAGFILK
ncbi:MAG: glycoside hydrolase family 3 C-terminal domain-containing protein [Methylococcaceae bacterium]|nr:glycoside hydrolase family 3 C-terminal domain-containing protein [Methylococcaceae bacterium]